jgi:hypothetical protein
MMSGAVVGAHAAAEIAAETGRPELCVLIRKFVCSMQIEGIQVGPP